VRNVLGPIGAGLTLLAVSWTAASLAEEPRRAPGYRGIWFTLGQLGEYGDKYSGGLGTYTAKHRPLAVYAEAVNKTFFVYGGGRHGERHLLIMASYYDHGQGQVPRPVIVHDKGGVDDPHDNASIALDGDGHVWVFVSGRGRSRPGFKYRSPAPYSIACEAPWALGWVIRLEYLLSLAVVVVVMGRFHQASKTRDCSRNAPTGTGRSRHRLPKAPR